MRSARNLYWIVTTVAACGLFVSGLAEQQDSGTEEGWRCGTGFQPVTTRLGWPCHLAQRMSVVPVCYVVGAVGVICLGWYWLRLKPAGRITSIAKWLKKDKAGTISRKMEPALAPPAMTRSGRSPVIKALGAAIDERFERYTNHIAELEKQVKDLQIQVRLSQRREKNAEAIIYSIRDAVIVIDEFDKLLIANEAAGRLFDFDFKSSQHKPVSELIGPDQNKFAEILRHSKQSKGRATRQEIRIADSGQRTEECNLNAKRPTLNSEEGRHFAISRKMGTQERTFDCIVSCVYDQNEQVCGTVAVLHDITREKEISRMKSDFVSHVSHELKTPLATITAYSEMLCDSEATDSQGRKEFYSVIRDQAKRLTALIEGILNISRIESGLIKINKEPASLTMLIEEQMRMIKSYAEDKNIKVTWQKPIVFDQVYVDKDMIRQVIVNLLSNAVKYTPCGGSVKIETEVDEVAGLARVSVADTGVGIPEDEIERVFDKFYRVDANKNKAEGTGLGLSLVKQIVEKVHNGRVFVTSQVGAGSSFGFELPLATGQAAEAV